MRELIERHAEDTASLMFGQTLPRQRFFDPTDIFWDKLKDIMLNYDIDSIVDCGTGNGELPAEAMNEHDIRMVGVDIIAREGNMPNDVFIMGAHQLPASNAMWRMVCRPDHSGWTEPLLEKSLEEDKCGFIYVGLPVNMVRDLNEWLERVTEVYTNVGKEGEAMLVFKP